MTKKKKQVVVTRKLPDTTETRLMELFDVKLNVSDEPMDASQLAEAMATADVLVPTAHAFDSERIPWFDIADNLPRYEGSSEDSPLLRHGPASHGPPSD